MLQKKKIFVCPSHSHGETVGCAHWSCLKKNTDIYIGRVLQLGAGDHSDVMGTVTEIFLVLIIFPQLNLLCLILFVMGRSPLFGRPQQTENTSK